MNDHNSLPPSSEKPHFSFGRALDALKGGAAVARAAWLEGTYLKMQRPIHENEAPYIYFNSDAPFDRCRDWHPEQGEILADDWHTVALSEVE